MLTRMSIILAYLAGLISLLPTLALAVILSAIAWVGLRFVYNMLVILLA